MKVHFPPRLVCLGAVSMPLWVTPPSRTALVLPPAQTPQRPLFCQDLLRDLLEDDAELEDIRLSSEATKFHEVRRCVWLVGGALASPYASSARR